MKDKSKIQIALASDDNYFVGLLVTAMSIAKHADAACDLVFNVLSGGIAPQKLEDLRQRLQAVHANTEMRVFEINQTAFSAFPEWHGEGRMTYARIMLPELLPEEDFVIYCDVDFLWTADIADLWQLRDPLMALQGCIDDHRQSLLIEEKWYTDRGIEVDISRYINCGMLIMNLRLFRAKNLARQLMDFLHRHPDVGFVDQTALNAVIGDRTLLPTKWGRFARSIHKEELPGNWAIHYAGLCPWKPGHPMQVIADAHMLWYRFYGELTGRGTWAAMREFLSLRQILTRRAVWIIAQHASLRFLLGILLCRTRYWYAAGELAQFAPSR